METESRDEETRRRKHAIIYTSVSSKTALWGLIRLHTYYNYLPTTKIFPSPQRLVCIQQQWTQF